jgi:hypothetical protein
MKYLKVFKVYEKLNGALRKIPPNFKVGDWVICIEPNFSTVANDRIKVGEKYYITEIDDDFDGVWRCKVKGKEQKYYCFRFISELEYNANKYNI